MDYLPLVILLALKLTYRVPPGISGDTGGDTGQTRCNDLRHKLERLESGRDLGFGDNVQAHDQNFGEGLGQVERRPSMCSIKFCAILRHIGSSTKSMPSRRASLAAGTKSASPATRTIWSTCFLKTNDATSTPMRISTPFWRTPGITSSGVSASNVVLPASKSAMTLGLMIQGMSVDKCPKRKANLRFNGNR